MKAESKKEYDGRSEGGRDGWMGRGFKKGMYKLGKP